MYLIVFIYKINKYVFILSSYVSSQSNAFPFYDLTHLKLPFRVI